MARRGTEVVGTIAAFINHQHNQFNHEHIGWFGAFDVRDDSEAAAALLAAAAQWVEGHGYEAIAGPQTFTTHGDCGVLIDGFVRPVMMMPYNYPYYQRYIETAGFCKREDLFSFHMSIEEAKNSGLQTRLDKLTQDVMERYDIHVRPIDRHQLPAEFQLLKELYNTGWDDTAGFFPLSNRDVDDLVKKAGRYFDPDFAFFAYAGNEAVGFLIGIPDFNQVIQRAYPRPGVPKPLTLLRAFYYWKINPVMDWMRIAMLGIKKAYRGKGVAVALAAKFVEAGMASKRYHHADSGWTGENNQPMLGLARNVGLQIYKTHRIYQKQLISVAAAES